MLRGGLYVGDKHFTQPLVDSVEILLEAFLERYYAEHQAIQNIYLDFKFDTEVNNNFHCIYKIKFSLL